MFARIHPKALTQNKNAGGANLQFRLHAYTDCSLTKKPQVEQPDRASVQGRVLQVPCRHVLDRRRHHVCRELHQVLGRLLLV